MAKTHLREELTDATNDAYIDTLVAAAQNAVENFTNRRLTATTYYMYLSAFPVDGITLPFSPISSITSITYYDATNSVQTLSSSAYQYKIYEEPLTITSVDDSWPATYEDRNDAVIVEFVTGYTSPDTCPDALKHAVKLLLGDMYSNRTNILKERFELWQMLAMPYRVFHSTMENQ